MDKGGDWTFLSNYAHVLVYLAENPGARLREVADAVGITERSAMRLITHLDDAGILTREKQGRRNYYTIDREVPLRHPIEAHCTVGQLLAMVLSRDELRRLERDQAKRTFQRAN